MDKIRKHIPHYFKLFRFYSTFFKTFFTVLVLSSFLFGSFCLYLLHRENKNLEEKSESSYINMLKTASTAMELTLQNMEQLMQQTIWRSEFTNALLIPTADNYTRTCNIIDQLNRLAESNPLISQAYFYVPTSRMIYSSDRSYLSVSDVSDHLPFDPDTLLSFSGSRLSHSPNAMFIKEVDGMFFLCQHLYPDNIESIGMLIFSFDPLKLYLPSGYQALREPEPLYVFDQQGKAVFHNPFPLRLSVRRPFY